MDKCLAIKQGEHQPPAKDVLQTYTGRVLRPLDPWPGDFDIEDIAWSLAMQCRYNGHTKMFYSVATHSRLVSGFCPPHLRLEGLLHDASEAYLCDMPHPLKQRMPEYQALEGQLESVIATQYHLVHPMAQQVKWADDYVFQCECALVMGGLIGEKFAIPMCPDRLNVEAEILAAATRRPREEAEAFLCAYRRIMETRGADIQAAR